MAGRAAPFPNQCQCNIPEHRHWVTRAFFLQRHDPFKRSAPTHEHAPSSCPNAECYYRRKVRLQTWCIGSASGIKKKKVFPVLLLCRILTLAFLTIASITHVKPFQQATRVCWAAKWIRLRNNTSRWMLDVNATEGSAFPFLVHSTSSAAPPHTHSLAGLCFSDFDTDD